MHMWDFKMERAKHCQSCYLFSFFDAHSWHSGCCLGQGHTPNTPNALTWKILCPIDRKWKQYFTLTCTFDSSVLIAEPLTWLKKSPSSLVMVQKSFGHISFTSPFPCMTPSSRPIFRDTKPYATKIAFWFFWVTSYCRQRNASGERQAKAVDQK